MLIKLNVVTTEKSQEKNDIKKVARIPDIMKKPQCITTEKPSENSRNRRKGSVAREISWKQELILTEVTSVELK